MKYKKKPLPKITEPDEKKVHYSAPWGLDQVTLCGLSDFLGATQGVETDLPVTCFACKMIAGFCQDHADID